MAVESRKEHSDNSRILTREKNVIADQESRHHRDASDWGTRVGSTNPIRFSPIHSDRQSAAEDQVSEAYLITPL